MYLCMHVGMGVLIWIFRWLEMDPKWDGSLGESRAGLERLPGLVNSQFATLKMVIMMWSYPSKMVIFHSYVSLPEGSDYDV